MARLHVRPLHPLLLTLLWACSDPGSVGVLAGAGAIAQGSVRVTAATTGGRFDTDYTVTIGSLSRTMPPNGSVTITEVPIGAATVQLSGVAANCTVTDSASRSVTVVASETVDAHFAVVCEATAGPVGTTR